MCSIMGMKKAAASRKAFEKGFAATVSRGPDMAFRFRSLITNCHNFDRNLP